MCQWTAWRKKSQNSSKREGSPAQVGSRWAGKAIMDLASGIIMFYSPASTLPLSFRSLSLFWKWRLTSQDSLEVLPVFWLWNHTSMKFPYPCAICSYNSSSSFARVGEDLRSKCAHSSFFFLTRSAVREIWVLWCVTAFLSSQSTSTPSIGRSLYCDTSAKYWTSLAHVGIELRWHTLI